MKSLFEEIQEIYRTLRAEKKDKFKRRVSFGDLFTDRWENAKYYGFGEGTSCYDNVLVLGDVQVGKNTWIGPNVILDGSGGPLVIGDFCSISAGVQIYTHNTVAWSTSLGKEKHSYAPTKIGNGVYIGPQTTIEMGVTIGDQSVIGAMSLVKSDIPAQSRAWGIPAKIQD
jgi:acetyltransferase-like isoleucine patch superfamily enzyme